MLTPLAVLFVLIPAAAGAQTAGISGTVKDSTGGALPGAVVKVVDQTSGAALEVVVDAEGRYEAAALTAGTYRVAASLDGFETLEREVSVFAGTSITLDLTLEPARLTEGVIVTARRVEEEAQEVPIPLSVVTGALVEDTGAFNVNRLKELVPTVQFYSTNPRNSAVNIRGLGAPFGLTNDGLEPGVGLYIDGVFFARPAAATLDFLDVERVEVLRGPQGTLFGKNTTAGAINVTTKKPSFTHAADVELSYGNFGFVQAKASVTSPLGTKVAGRLSFSGTGRGGIVRHAISGDDVNDMDNLGLRGQLLFAPSASLAIVVATDYTRQRPRGYTQVVAGIAPTLRPANRQWPQIAADLHYTPPAADAFDRVTDVDTPLRSYQDLGGASVNIDWNVGRGQVTSITSWRYWNWNPSNDRDFVALPVTTVSAAPSVQHQWTQEVRFADVVSPRLNYVVGAFAFLQDLSSNPSFQQEHGPAAARVLLAPSPAAAAPGLLDGYGFRQTVAYDNTSAAIFGQAEVSVGPRLRLLPGLRFNYDRKTVDFDQTVYGGLQTSDPVLIALQRSVLAPQAYAADVDDTNLSGQISASVTISPEAHAYATYATSYKSIGLNLNGVPADAQGRPVIAAATVKPEDVRNIEAGLKTSPFRGTTANLTVFDTTIRDFQTQVTNASVGVLRGYLANAEKVRVRGVEIDGTARLGPHASLYGAAAYTDGRYVSFPDAPPPLEETGGPPVKDISGEPLPGISKWALSLGGEYARPTAAFGAPDLQWFAGLDTSCRSSFSSSATASAYLYVDGYSLVNARLGLRAREGWSVYLWGRNLAGTRYYELLSAAPGNTGLYVGQPGDPRTFGITLRLGVRGH